MCDADNKTTKVNHAKDRALTEKHHEYPRLVPENRCPFSNYELSHRKTSPFDAIL